MLIPCVTQLFLSHYQPTMSKRRFETAIFIASLQRLVALDGIPIRQGRMFLATRQYDGINYVTQYLQTRSLTINFQFLGCSYADFIDLQKLAASPFRKYYNAYAVTNVHSSFRCDRLAVSDLKCNYSNFVSYFSSFRSFAFYTACHQNQSTEEVRKYLLFCSL